MIIASISFFSLLASMNDDDHHDDILCQYLDVVSSKHFSSFGFTYKLILSSSHSFIHSSRQCHDDFSLSLAFLLFIVAFSAYHIRKCKYRYRRGTLGEKKNGKQEIFPLCLFFFFLLLLVVSFRLHSSKCVNTRIFLLFSSFKKTFTFYSSI